MDEQSRQSLALAAVQHIHTRLTHAGMHLACIVVPHAPIAGWSLPILPSHRPVPFPRNLVPAQHKFDDN